MRRTINIFSVAFFLLSAAVFIYGGLLGLAGGQAEFRDMDFANYWAAGRLCLEGKNPYEVDEFRAFVRSHRLTVNEFFGYPPNMLPLASAFALMDFPAAALAWRAANVLALALTIFLAIRWLAPEAGPGAKMWLASYSMLLAPTIIAAHMGQVSLLVLCGVALAGWAAKKKRRWPGGLGLALAALKPQILLVFLLYFIARRQWKMLLVGGAICLFMSAAGLLLMNGPLLSIPDSLRALAAHPHNQPRDDAVLALYGLLAKETALAPRTAVILSTALGVALIVPWFASEWRSRGADDRLSVPFAVTAILMFVNVHTYDAVLLIFLWALVLRRDGVPGLWRLPYAVALWAFAIPGRARFMLVEFLGAKTGISFAPLTGIIIDYRHWLVAALFLVAAGRYVCRRKTST